MGRSDLERVIDERRRAVGRVIAEQLREARLEPGLSLDAVARAAGLDPSHLLRIERQERLPSLPALVAIATALGRDVSIRLYPSAGPRIRDHIQARMIEALLEVLHPRWLARLEVPVYRPVRGVIDVLLQDRETQTLVAGEGHSQLRAVEHLLRRAAEKADAVPSARGWPWTDTLAPPPVSRLLLLRNTAANRALVHDLPATFRAAYPFPSRDAYEALTGPAPWPGPALVWIDVSGVRTRVMHGAPRGVAG